MLAFITIYLSRDSDFIVCLEPQWALAFVRVVKRDGHSCFGDSSLSVLIHQILEIGRTYLEDGDVCRCVRMFVQKICSMT